MRDTALAWLLSGGLSTQALPAAVAEHRQGVAQFGKGPFDGAFTLENGFLSPVEFQEPDMAKARSDVDVRGLAG